MNILYLTSRFPHPPNRGDRLLSCNILRTLSKRHRVTLASFSDRHLAAGEEAELRRICHRVEVIRLTSLRSWVQAWMGLASPVPSQVSYYGSRGMRDRIRALAASEPYDAIIVQLFRMAPYASKILARARVLLLTDSLALALERSRRFQPWWRRLPVEWERRRVSRYEIEISRDFDECWVLSDVDRLDLERRGCANVKVVSPGVDERLFELPVPAPRSPRVVFLGNLSVPHNIDAASYLARELWPIIRMEVPTATLDLVGADPASAVRALGTLPGVRVTGLIPDLATLWRETSVMVAPLRFSSGVQTKVLEAAAASVPIVTTPQVAEALGAKSGEVLLVGADTPSLARSTVDVLKNPERYREMAARARSFIRARFTWDEMVTRLEALSDSRRGAP